LREEAGVPFEVTIQEGEPGQAIRTAAEDLKTDLVIIGRGKIQKPFGRLRSHAYAIIRDAPCPVISV
jgi:nucleotide-binding universal stress UspA family protein